MTCAIPSPSFASAGRLRLLSPPSVSVRSRLCFAAHRPGRGLRARKKGFLIFLAGDEVRALGQRGKTGRNQKSAQSGPSKPAKQARTHLRSRHTDTDTETQKTHTWTQASQPASQASHPPHALLGQHRTDFFPFSHRRIPRTSFLPHQLQPTPVVLFPHPPLIS